jgi:uncharacterized protein YjbI with pentapeptide repeats
MLTGVDLWGAILKYADFMGACLNEANLREADMAKVDLRRAMLLRAKVSHAKLSGGWIYGVSIWDLDGELAEQIDPAIQRHNELRLIKARELKLKSASAFIDDKGWGNQSTE